MQLFLTFYDPTDGPKTIIIKPKLDESELISSILGKILEMNLNQTAQNDFAEISEGNFANFVFQIPSTWNTSGFEKLMLSVTLDEHENPKIFRSIFNRYVDRLKAMPESFKGLYIKSKKTDPKIPLIYNQIDSLMAECLRDLEKMVKRQAGLAEIIFLGIGAVGKTCIINRLITGQFDSRIRPTLSTQILKLFFEQMDFQVYDVGGQVRLRQFWGQALKRPHAIIYVLDVTHTAEQQKDAQTEFNRMMEFYYNEMGIPKTIPVLLLGNKSDQNNPMTIDQIKADYNPDKFGMNYQIHKVSALTGDGLTDAFKWIASQIKVTARI